MLLRMFLKSPIADCIARIGLWVQMKRIEPIFNDAEAKCRRE